MECGVTLGPETPMRATAVGGLRPPVSSTAENTEGCRGDARQAEMEDAEKMYRTTLEFPCGEERGTKCQERRDRMSIVDIHSRYLSPVSPDLW